MWVCEPLHYAYCYWRYYAINAAWDVVIWSFFVETRVLVLEDVDELFDEKIHPDNVFNGRGDDVHTECGWYEGET